LDPNKTSRKRTYEYHRFNRQRHRGEAVEGCTDLSVLVLVIYFGFILLVAFGKPFLSILITPGLSVGILLGAATIVSCWILCLIYVAWANAGYDEEVAEAARSRRAS
jgi:uncharacterized membrane protein (DUF485 family)